MDKTHLLINGIGNAAAALAIFIFTAAAVLGVWSSEYGLPAKVAMGGGIVFGWAVVFWYMARCPDVPAKK